ncbi:MAG: hypothetical protein ACI3UZ_01300 [Oscillospiraceae bacterium]|nr:hypothetical protein [Oscillospiraceae bacterium]
MDYENENEFSALLDMLQSAVVDAWSVPLSKDKCMLPREKTIELIEEIKRQFPIEITEAKRLLASKEDFVANAKREAELIRKAAEEQARRLVEEEEITRIARAHANEIISTADSKARELMRVANDYVDDALRRTEEAIGAAANEIHQSRARFRSLAVSRPVVAQPAEQQPQQEPEEQPEIIDEEPLEE